MFESGQREVLFLMVTRALAEQCATDLDKGLLVLGSAPTSTSCTRRPAWRRGSRTLIRVGETEIAEDYASVKLRRTSSQGP